MKQTWRMTIKRSGSPLKYPNTNSNLIMPSVLTSLAGVGIAMSEWMTAVNTATSSAGMTTGNASSVK